MTLACGIVGVVLYYVIPPKYLASGTLYVERAVENGGGRYFTYEGYYNQQTAVSYTNTVLGLLDSDDIKTLALRKLGIQINEQSLRKFNSQIKTTKTGNQLITLSVKGATPQKAESAFNALSQVTISTSDRISQTSDPYLHLTLITDQPVVRETFRNVWVNLAIGVLSGFLLAVLYLSFSTYLKEQA